MQPVLLTVNGTGTSSIVTPDRDQNPFAIAIGVNVSGTGNGTTIGWSIQHSFDSLDAPTATVTNWFTNSAVGTSGSQAMTSVLQLDMNYAYPVTAIRLNVATALATTTVQARIIQATNAP